MRANTYGHSDRLWKFHLFLPRKPTNSPQTVHLSIAEQWFGGEVRVVTVLAKVEKYPLLGLGPRPNKFVSQTLDML